FFFQAEDGIRDFHVTGVQTCALPISIAYEVDLFGRLSAATQAGREGLRASAFASDAVRITLIATVVSGYIDLRGLDAQLRMVSRSEERRVGKEWRLRGWAEE